MAKLNNKEFYDKWVPLLADNVFQEIDGARFEQLLADLRDSFASTADLSAQPVAPAVNFDPVTRVLSATHLLGALELEYNRNNGGFTAYQPLTIDDLGHPQGEWRFRVKADAGRNASQTTDSPEIVAKGTANPAGPGKIKSTDISDSTEAGRALLTAKDVAALRTLLDQLGYRAEQYGKGQPKFDTLFGEDGALVYLLRNAAGQSAPAAPTGVEVDDTSDTLSGILVAGYPAVADYEVFGAPDFPGVVNASAARADIQNGRIISRGLKGNILAGGAGIRVAANGNHPAGAWMLNDKAFTGVITPPAPLPTTDTVKPEVYFTVPASGATLAPNSQVLLTAIANDNVGVQGPLTFTNGATGQVIGLGAKNGSTYTFPYTTGAAGPLSIMATATDAAGNSQSATVNVIVQAATVPPTPGSALTAALAISVASIMAGNPLTFEVTAGGGTEPYAYAVKATNNATGAVTILGSSAVGSFTPQTGGTSYNIDATVTDAAGNTKPAQTRTVQVSSPQSVNQLPVVSVGDHLTIALPTSSAVLTATASDPDAGDTLTYVWRQITGPNNATGLPAASLSIVVSGLVPGTYQFGFQATDQKGGKSPEAFIVVTVKEAVSQNNDYTLTPDFSHFSQTGGINRLQTDGRYRHASFAVLEADTTANKVTVTVKSTDARGGFTVYLNDVLIGSYKTGIGTVGVAVNLPGSGTRRLKVVEASADGSPDPLGIIIGTTIVGLTFPAGTTSSFYVSQFEEIIIGFGDSILTGAICANRERDGWFARLRTAKRGMIADSYGSRTAKSVIGTQADIDNALAVLATGFAGVSKRRVWFGLQVNDWIFQAWTPAQYAAALASFIDQAHAQDPTITFYLQTAILIFSQGGEGYKANGYTLQDFRDAMASVVPSRSAYCVLVDGKLLATEAEIAGNGGDGLHPAELGHANWAQRAEAILSGITSPWYSGPPSQFVTLTGNEIARTSNGGQDAWDGFTLGKYCLEAPAPGFVGEVGRLIIPNPSVLAGGITVGFSTSSATTAAGTDRRQLIPLGVYVDRLGSCIWKSGIAIVPYLQPLADNQYNLVAYHNRIELQRNGQTLDSIPNTAFPLYVHGVLFYSQVGSGTVSRITNMSLQGSTLATFTPSTGVVQGPQLPPAKKTWRSTNPPNEYVTYDENTNVLSKTTPTGAWDGFGLGLQRVRAPDAGTANSTELARLKLPYPATVEGTIVVGFSASATPTAAGTDRRQSIIAGIYCDTGTRNPWRPDTGGAQTNAIPQPQSGFIEVVVFPDRIVVEADGTVYTTVPSTPRTLYLFGVSYFGGESNLNAKITGAVLSGTHVEDF
jgi:hypothetical protein